MMPRKMDLAFAQIWMMIQVTVTLVEGFQPGVYNYCCDIGNRWYESNDDTCPPHPVVDASSSTQGACSVVVGICCLAQRRSQLCLRGQTSALSGQTCLSVPDESRECCECCQLGALAADAGLPCEAPRHFGADCQQSFSHCCRNKPQNIVFTGTAAPVVTMATDAVAKVTYPGASSVDLCAKVTGTCQQLCRNTGSGFECLCHPGYRLNSDGWSCGDVNECSDVIHRHNCSAHEKCINTFGGFRCRRNQDDAGSASHLARSIRECPLGHRWNRRARRCEDIDECSVGQHKCSFGTTCVNSKGGYSCVPPSARASAPPITTPDSPSTASISSSSAATPGLSVVRGSTSTMHPALAAIRPTTGLPGRTRPRPFHIRRTPAARAPLGCGPGFQLNHDTGLCEDYDECLAAGTGCPFSNMVCRNTIGSFACTCSTGYLFNPRSQVCEDIDECRTNRHDCTGTEVCENFPGSFVCRSGEDGNCRRGFALDPVTGRCTDINECTQQRNTCGFGSTCINTPGSFRCELITCDEGMRLNTDGKCADIDECVENSRICPPHQRCRNTPGSFVCWSPISCSVGYEMNSAGTSCEDIDECDRGRHSCNGTLMTCVNRPGTYVCQCPSGYQMNHANHRCDDIDECHMFGGHVCAQNAKCENTPGSFKCACQAGFQMEPQSRYCIDINECSRFGLCQHSCRNTWGSYYCSCNDGYHLSRDGRNCTDIDECSLGTESGGRPGGGVCLGLCHNIPGSYICSCPVGYQMSSDGRTCQDIDECSLRLADCYDPDDICLNQGGSYECRRIICPSGFVKTPKVDFQAQQPSGRSSSDSSQSWNNGRNYRGPTYSAPGRHGVGNFHRLVPSTTSVRPFPSNVLRSVISRPIFFLSDEDSGVICQKAECAANDISCILNMTKSIQWQHVLLPSIAAVSDPITIINVQTIAASVHPNNEFSIIAGNDLGLFDVVRKPGFGDRGSVRLLKAISGPAEHRLTLRMDNYDRYHNIISQHIAHIVITVSRYRF